MDKTRLEAFSDGVIAVAITLLVIDLRVPEPLTEPGAGASLGHRLGEQWPSFAAYVVSFLTIGVIWINHHAMLRLLRAADRSVLILNIVLLMTIVVLPFTTSLMARYLTADDGRTLAAVVYGGSLLLMSVVFVTMNWHILTHRVALLRDDVTPALRRTILLRNLVGVAPYTVATVGALVSPYVTLVIAAALATYFMSPLATPDSSGGGPPGG